MERYTVSDDLISKINKLKSDLNEQYINFKKIYDFLDNHTILELFNRNNNKGEFLSKLNQLQLIVDEIYKIDLEGKQYSHVFIEYIKERTKSNYYGDLKELVIFLEDNMDNLNPLEKFIDDLNEESNFIYRGGYTPDYRLCDYLYRITDNIDYLIDDNFQFVKILNLIEPISQIEGNLVIVGSNGSGKSTLSRQLKIGNSEEFSIISAQHFLLLPQEAFQFYLDGSQIDIDSYQSKNKLVISEDDLDTNDFIYDFHNIINYLLVNHSSLKGDTKSDVSKKSILQRIIEIFNEVTTKEIFIKNSTLKFMGENEESFEINYLSDGERQILYFISNILIKKNDCYYIIDEPENHLNSQVSKLLWDKLEQEKPESIFIYITHDPDFAASRKNSNIIWSKKYTYPYNWEIEIIEDDEIPDEILIEILGSKKNILFCEGSYNSLDYFIYSSLFDEFKVMPVDGHLNVINYTKAINKLKLTNIAAKGIIDKDFNDKDYIESLKKENVFVSKFNEIEMLLIDENILLSVKDAMLRFSGREFDIEKFKSKVLEKFYESKEKIILSKIKCSVEYKISNEKIDGYKSKEEIKKYIENLSRLFDVDAMYEESLVLINKIYTSKDYSKLLEVCNLKDEIVKGIANDFIKGDYISISKQQIVLNEELRIKIVDNYFKEINNLTVIN
ncbi:hypothetical protein EVU91_12790 [Macrococcoides bohemicum]|uniref:DUF4435 domain-containing protein n=1 Tax=Macrococcoides bohemicum TaxID=1903056 RepID=UPI0010599CAC|nr:DUF4435 domain-containing protein [Macrococcus bohemicus]TDL33537.1 hypothetical protein EVU91_12790 [Macrococcus bohemicus]